MRKSILLIALLLAACAPQPTPTPFTANSTFNVSIQGAWARPAQIAEMTPEAAHMTGHSMHNTAEATAEATEAAEHDMSGMQQSSMSSAVSAIYLRITNNGAADLRLVSATTTIASVTQIHETVITNDVASMSELTDGLVIPAGQTVELRPGGIHIMLMNLQSSLIEGSTVAVTLTFDTGDTVTVDAAIQIDAPSGN
jgi:hypothetical protein